MATATRKPVKVPSVKSPVKPLVLADTMDEAALFGSWFEGPSWDVWRVVARAQDGLPMTEADRLAFEQIADGRAVPTAPVSELWAFVGRRGGKSAFAAASAVHAAVFRDYKPFLKPGEKAAVLCVATDREQAGVVFGYVLGLFDTVPALAGMVASRTKESVTLVNGVTILVKTCSFRRIRGFTVVAAIFDEVCFWVDDEGSRNPAGEVLRAIRPAMATIPGARLVCISSVYAKKGSAWEQFKRYFGKDDARVLVLLAATDQMNPSIDPGFIAAEYEKDPVSAASEYGSRWRDDITDYISDEVLEGVTPRGLRSEPVGAGLRYFMYFDAAGGSNEAGDSCAAALSYFDRPSGESRLARVAEWRPRFDPVAVADEVVALAKAYNVHRIRCDRYSGGTWPSLLKAAGKKIAWRIAVQFSDQTASDLYHDVIPLLTGRKARLLDVPRLLAQFRGLERTVSRVGRDTITHAPRAHDDLANVAAGSLLMASRPQLMGDLGDQERARPAGGEVPVAGRPRWSGPAWARGQRVGDPIMDKSGAVVGRVAQITRKQIIVRALDGTERTFDRDLVEKTDAQLVERAQIDRDAERQGFVRDHESGEWVRPEDGTVMKALKVPAADGGRGEVGWYCFNPDDDEQIGDLPDRLVDMGPRTRESAPWLACPFYLRGCPASQHLAEPLGDGWVVVCPNHMRRGWNNERLARESVHPDATPDTTLYEPGQSAKPGTTTTGWRA